MQIILGLFSLAEPIIKPHYKMFCKFHPFPEFCAQYIFCKVSNIAFKFHTKSSLQTYTEIIAQIVTINRRTTEEDIVVALELLQNIVGRQEF